MKMQPSFNPKHSRPLSLVNQRCCFSDEELAEIISSSDKDLTFSEYRTLFHIARCVGTYDQLVYFLPHALEYIKQNPDAGLECLSQIIHFLSSEVESLERDGLIELCRKEIWLWFERWTRSFSVRHYDEQSCKQKGWVIKYDDIVQNSQLVSELIDDLVRYRAHADLAQEMVRSLAQQDQDGNRSAWFLEYAREVRVGHQGMEASKDCEIQQLITDNELLQTHYDGISNTVVAQEESPTYWADLCKALSLKSA